MSELILAAAEGAAAPIHPIWEGDTAAPMLSAAARNAAALGRFTGAAGQTVVVAGEGGLVEAVLVGLGARRIGAETAFRALAAALPPGDYAIVDDAPGLDRRAAALAWARGGYRFDRYRSKRGEPPARLVSGLAEPVLAEVRQVAHALALGRDMINTGANDMGPRQVETIAREIAEAHGATIAASIGEDLLKDNYPAVHAVGRAATLERAPRMIELRWGAADHPLVALVGKGVVFDSGGLDIKPSTGMRWMKKDMGGAAHALALARMVMAAKLPLRLAVLAPVVENAISGDAMRPGDVLASRAGLSIEVGNTDAEGRLILADALARAAELEPDLTIDLATLTGAARVALGPQVAPFYTRDDVLAAALAAASEACADPLWRMPLWAPYAAALESDVADIKNDPEAWAQAGSVTAALFLERFAPKRGAWAHFDIFAWNPVSRPGAPQGAEMQAILALYEVLKARYR